MRAKSIHTISVLASAIALALPSTGSALGLGRLTVQSSLGQPLSATIELTSAAPQELDSLAARVADPSLYRQNNLSYQGVLARARVTLERTQGGQAFLRVVTPTPVNEPYLDLMVELNWAAGRVLREYTFLLDPPGLAAPTPAVEPVTPVRAGTAAPARATAAPSTPARAEAAPAAARGAAAGANSYTVRRGDSLARIANQLRPEGVTLEQMLVALFRANPDAFDANNMNRLRSGAILTLPPTETLSGTPEPDAAKVVRMQAADWRTYRDRVAAGAPVTEASGSRESGGKITTSVQERTPAAEPGRDQVRVSRDAGAGKPGTAAAEDAAARDRALKDAQTRIAELEKTLKDLQRAVEMRSQTMAQLQTQAEAGKGKAASTPAPVPSVAPAPVVAPPAVSPATPSPNAAVKAEAPKTEIARAEPAKTETPKTSEPGTTSTTAAATAPAATIASTTPPAPAAETPKAPVKAPKPEPTGAPSMFDDVLSSTPGWALGAGALALLAGIGALIAARRRKTTSFEDSIISGTDIKSNTVFGSTGGGIVNTGENSLSSDFSREGMSTIDTDEVDPIAEAEVYLAYGRDAQAEEILKDALKKDPQRQEVYLKLLEIHAQHNKPSAFEAVAAELYSVSRGQGETWQKAVALGRQLDPNNPLFSGDGAGVGAAAAAAGAAAASAAMVDTEAQALHEPMGVGETPASAPAVAQDANMDFQLDEDISISPTSAAARARSTADVMGGDAGYQQGSAGHVLDFDAPGTPHTPERAMEHGAAGSRPADPKFDLDFHLDDAERPEPVRAAGAGKSSAGDAPDLARPQAAIDLDKLDLSFDPDRTSFDDPTPSVLDGQWHDAATKLDLAKAYQEMGDVEGAREILQEVMHEGDEQQRGEAGALLQKLA